MIMKQLLSIQSAVLHGYVGNEAAALIYAMLGIDAARIDTIQLAAHPGHGPAHPTMLAAPDLEILLQDYCRLPAAAGLRALHSGYLATPEQGISLSHALPKLRQAAGDTLLYLLDPVLGDGGKFYVSETIATIMHDTLLPEAQIITPNSFELEVLSGMTVNDLATAERAAHRLLESGPTICLATGLSEDGAKRSSKIVDMLVVKDQPPQVFYNQSQADADRSITGISDSNVLGAGISGAGDCLAALFLGFHLLGKSPNDAAAKATSITHQIIASADDQHDMPLFRNRHLLG